jgi:glucokinase
MTRVLAIDLGGTHLRAAIYTGDIAAMEPLGREPAPLDRASFVSRLAALIKQAGAATAIGLAVPGLVDGSLCRWVPNLAFLDGADLATLLPCPAVVAGNDAQMALLAEARAGAAAGLSDAILLAIGTGIGSAVLAGGRIVAGAHGGACSFGWAAVDSADAGDPRHGWLEQTASGRALDRIARLNGLTDGAALVAAARAGETTALAALERPAAALGTALAGAVALLDPKALLVSGGLADALDILAPPVLAALRRHLPSHLAGIEIRAARFGARATLIGAALAGAAGGDWRRVR